MFIACVTSDKFQGKNSNCEKRIITDLSKTGQPICPRYGTYCKSYKMINKITFFDI
jgi:hypothetical protein